MELSDASDVFAYAREPAVLRYTTGRTPLDVSETEAYLRDSLSDPTNYCWAIRERAEGPVIGAIDLGLQLPDVGRLCTGGYTLGARLDDGGSPRRLGLGVRRFPDDCQTAKRRCRRQHCLVASARKVRVRAR